MQGPLSRETLTKAALNQVQLSDTQIHTDTEEAPHSHTATMGDSLGQTRNDDALTQVPVTGPQIHIDTHSLDVASLTEAVSQVQLNDVSSAVETILPGPSRNGAPEDQYISVSSAVETTLPGPSRNDAPEDQYIRICVFWVSLLLYPEAEYSGIHKGELKFLCVLFEMDANKIDVMCVINHRWKGKGYFQYTYNTQNFHIYHNNDKTYGGVAVFMTERLHAFGPNVDYFMSANTGKDSKRIIRIKFKDLDIIAIVAPTENKKSERKIFVEEIGLAVADGSKSLIVFGDFSTWNKSSQPCLSSLTQWWSKGFFNIYARGINISKEQVTPIHKALIDMKVQSLQDIKKTDIPFPHSLKETDKSALQNLLVEQHGNARNEVRLPDDPLLEKIAELWKRQQNSRI